MPEVPTSAVRGRPGKCMLNRIVIGMRYMLTEADSQEKKIGLSREWFIVWISPECELDILLKTVKSCLWTQDFPGCTENWFYWFLWLVLSARRLPPHPFQASCTSETQTQQVRFYLLKCFQKHWILSLVPFLLGNYYLDSYCYLLKCSCSQNDLIFFITALVFSENTNTFLKHNTHLQFKNSALNHRAEALHRGIWSQPTKFCYRKYKFTQNTFHSGRCPVQSLWLIVRADIAHRLQTSPK